ncbi:MAG: putative replicase [Cressdnaviricota sp.]|nr:MAG: putative replicase [Cressdnaviricota sp.]
MVCEKFLILDEGIKKYVAEYKMNKPQHVKDFEKIIDEMENAREKYDHFHYGVKNGYRVYDPEYDKILLEDVKKWDKDVVWLKTWNNNVQPKFWWDKKLCEYMNVIPFTPSVMINISPAWKGKKGIDKIKINLLEITILKYLKASNRYDYFSYVIECGGEGDHIHAHIVAHINNDIGKSVLTHINKGNHSVEIKKIFQKCLKEHKMIPKGIEGALKGKYAIQRIMLRNQDLVDDKLSYLHEEKKPDGHKNAEHPICPKLVVFTSKDQQA